jgi:hypothetical protein
MHYFFSHAASPFVLHEDDRTLVFVSLWTLYTGLYSYCMINFLPQVCYQVFCSVWDAVVICVVQEELNSIL